MRTFPSLLGLLLFAVLPGPALAGPLEEGTQAYKENDFVHALLLLQPLADEGNARAQAMVGEMFLLGCCGVAQDLETGLNWIRKAAAQGDVEAESSLGGAYLDGRGTNVDYAQAMSWFVKAAEQGDSFAQHSIGEMYEKGLGVAKNQDEAKKWYAKARRRPQLPKEFVEGLAATTSVTLYSLEPWGGPDIPQWDFHDQHVLGRVDLSGKQAKKAVGALTAALSMGDANIMAACMITPRHALAFQSGSDHYDILICYQCGQLEPYKNDHRLSFEGMIGGIPADLNGLLKSAGIPLAGDPGALRKSYAEEAKVALKLAKEGDTTAQGVIGRMFMKGRGVKKDEAKGIEWLAKSQGVSVNQVEFQVALAKMYMDEHDQWLRHDYAKGLKLFRQAAAQGNAQAQYEIGTLYDFGQGVPKNPAEAMKWFRQAAENGYAEAQFEIGVRSAQGRDVKEDYAEALRWIRLAAEQSHPEALAWMGTLYKEGWGVTKDQMEAYFWDRLAVKYHTSYGNRVPFRATAEQFAALEKRIADWIAAHPKRWERPW